MFFFDCGCDACVGGYPTYRDLPSRVESGLAEKLRVLEGLLGRALSAGDYQEGLKIHCKDVHLIEQGLQEPHRIYVSVRNSMQHCLWKVYG